MKGNFELIKLDNEPYDFLVIATSSISPLSCLDEIVAELNNIDANVLFDLTLINGINSNRYLQGKCLSGKFSLKDFATVQDIDLNIKTISYKFFRNNEYIVQNSVLTKTVKFLLREEMI